MTLANCLRPLYWWSSTRSAYMAAGGGRHVAEMRSPRIVRDGWMATIVAAEWTPGKRN